MVIRLLPILAATVALLTLAVACASDTQQEAAKPSEEGSAIARELPERPDLEPLVKGLVSPDGLQAILGTGDLGVGTNRVGFLLTSEEGIVTTPTVKVSSLYLVPNSPTSELKQTAIAEFHLWPYATRGLYTTQLTFDMAGSWALEIEVEDPPGSVRSVGLLFQVAETAFAPTVGSPAVKSRSKTLADVEGFGKLTTGSLHDPDLYQQSIADAVENGLPTVVLFASPAFCTNAVCGPQIEVLQELKNRYRGEANFIHVDFYDNPDEIQGDLDRARISPVVREWRLPSIEWTFVIDRQGIVSERFEAFTTLVELEAALLRVM